MICQTPIAAAVATTAVAQRVLRVGEQEHWRLDRREGSHQLFQFTYQGALLGQEGTPQRA